MAHLCRRPGFTQETKLCRFVTQVPFANDLQGHRTPQVDIERLVGDTHSSPTQLDRSAIVVQHHFIVLESTNLRRTFRIPRAAC
jgi:hypothetical protein